MPSVFQRIPPASMPLLRWNDTSFVVNRQKKACACTDSGMATLYGIRERREQMGVDNEPFGRGTDVIEGVAGD